MMERSHSGLVRPLGERICRKASRVRIPASPPCGKYIFGREQLGEQSHQRFAYPSVASAKEGISHPPQVEDLIIKVIIKV